MEMEAEDEDDDNGIHGKFVLHFQFFSDLLSGFFSILLEWLFFS